MDNDSHDELVGVNVNSAVSILCLIAAVYDIVPSYSLQKTKMEGNLEVFQVEAEDDVVIEGNVIKSHLETESSDSESEVCL